MSDRLQKVLSQAGVASRRAAEKLILDGKVTVNGKVAHLGQSVEESDEIIVNNQPVFREKQTYIMLNKPTGFITTAKDTHNRKTVMDLLPKLRVRVFPVGRLDKDTEGLLLFTNDGELANRLMHPSRHVEKTYLVEVEGHLSKENITALETGIELFDGITAHANVAGVHREKDYTRFLLTIHEGRKRQIRRMCGVLGRKVLRLARLSLGPLSIGDLQPGSFRYLTTAEVELLYKATEE